VKKCVQHKGYQTNVRRKQSNLNTWQMRRKRKTGTNEYKLEVYENETKITTKYMTVHTLLEAVISCRNRLQ